MADNIPVNQGTGPQAVPVATQEINGIHYPVSLDFLVEVSKGNIPGHSVVNKFGTNEDVDVGTEMVWEHGGFAYYPVTAIQWNVTSLSADDAAAGTGARTLRIVGLDANWLEQEETITLTGQAIVQTQLTYIRIFRAYNVTAGSGGVNAGEIHVFEGTATAGLPDDETQVVTQISAGHGQTQQAFYSVPAGKTAYLLYGYATTDAGAKPIEAKFYIRPDADTADAAWRISADLKTGGDYTKVYTVYPAVPAKTDMKVEVTASANNTYVSAGFDLLLVDNTLLP